MKKKEIIKFIFHLLYEWTKKQITACNHLFSFPYCLSFSLLLWCSFGGSFSFSNSRLGSCSSGSSTNSVDADSMMMSTNLFKSSFFGKVFNDSTSKWTIKICIFNLIYPFTLNFSTRVATVTRRPILGSWEAIVS